MRPNAIYLRLALTVLLSGFATVARGQAWQTPGGPAGAAAPDYRPDELKNVSLTERGGATIPLDTTFTDDAGQPVQLSKYFTGKRPVVLQLGYFGCPMLCGIVTHGLLDSLKDVSLVPGKDFDVLYISINPSETPTLAAQKKQSYLADFGHPDTADGWHFLTGRNDQIIRLAESVGFNFRWVQSAGQYAHPAAIIFLTPEGKVSRYLGGVRYDPKTVRLSIVEASQGKVGTLGDQLYLSCFQFDGHQGRYAFTALYIMRGGGVLMMIIVGTVLTRMFLRERRELAAKETAGAH